MSLKSVKSKIFVAFWLHYLSQMHVSWGRTRDFCIRLLTLSLVPASLKKRYLNRRIPVSRIVTIGAAQLGPIAPDESRASAVNRMIELLKQAGDGGCNFGVFPELVLTTFSPRN